MNYSNNRGKNPYFVAPAWHSLPEIPEELLIKLKDARKNNVAINKRLLFRTPPANWIQGYTIENFYNHYNNEDEFNKALKDRWISKCLYYNTNKLFDIPKTPLGDEILIFLLKNFDLFSGRRIHGGKKQRNKLIGSIFTRLIKHDNLKQHDLYCLLSKSFHISENQVRHIVYDQKPD